MAASRRKPGAHRERRSRQLPRRGHHEGERRHQRRRDARHRAALADGEPGLCDVAGLERPQAAVHRLGVIEGAAAAEVAALDERGGEAPLRRVVGDGEAVDAAADDEHVESFRREAGSVAGHDVAALGALPEGPEYSIVSGRARQDHAAARRRGPGVLEPPHPRPGDHDAPAGLAGVLRGSRRVPFRQAAPPARPRRLQRLRRAARARGRLRRRRRPGALRQGRRGGHGRRRRRLGRRAGPGEPRHQSLSATLCVGDGERLPFPDDTFDFVYAHGVVQYTADDRALVDECRRVLKPGGTAFFQVYNRVSWLNALSRVMKVGLEHEDAPVIRKYSPGEFRSLLSGFSERPGRPRALPGEVAPARGLEGHALQPALRRHVQRHPAAARAALRMASAGVLPEVALHGRGGTWHSTW